MKGKMLDLHSDKKMTKQQFENLPNEVKEEIRNVLKAYDSAHVEYHSGKYWVGAGCGIIGKYPEDFKSYGKITVKDVFTLDERITNYEETFGYQPSKFTIMAWTEEYR